MQLADANFPTQHGENMQTQYRGATSSLGFEPSVLLLGFKSAALVKEKAENLQSYKYIYETLAYFNKLWLAADANVVPCTSLQLSISLMTIRPPT